MKRLFIILLCVLLMGLYACVPTEPSQTTTDTTTTTTTMPATENTTKSAEMPTKVYEGIPKIEIQANENDPYSSMVKEHFDRAFTRAVENINPDYLDWNRHYYYALYDLDSDGTEELLWCDYYSNNKEYSRWDQYPDTQSIDKVYTIQNGAVVEVDGFESLSLEMKTHTSLLKNGVIRKMCLLNWEMGDNEDIKDAPSYIYFRLENGKRSYVAELYVDDRGKYWYVGPGDDRRTRITKKKFESLRQECEGDGQLMELDWRPLTEYGRKP